jgi:hypothetical protein
LSREFDTGRSNREEEYGTADRTEPLGGDSSRAEDEREAATDDMVDVFITGN